jgi:general secretion pathway protein H
LPAERTGAASGFTLIELVVVLAIIGLSLAVVLPLLGRSVPGVALGAAAEEVRAALREARLTAIGEDRAVVFRADPAGGYWLDRQYRRVAAAARLPGALRLATAGAAPIAFFPSGGSSGGQVFIDAAGGRRELAVDAVTGRASPVP